MGQPARVEGLRFTRATMELADLPGHPARAAARRHKRSVEAFFGEQLARDGLRGAETLARQIVLLLEGCMALILVHGDPIYADAGAEAARQLVERCRARGG
jgi:hypothetical protein